MGLGFGFGFGFGLELGLAAGFGLAVGLGFGVTLNAARVAGVMPHRWPRPLPSIRSMKVVWSCSSLRPIASRTRHSAMLAMPGQRDIRRYREIQGDGRYRET